MQDASDARLFSPSTARNRGPILDVLKRVLPGTGTVLEIASGTGEHVVHFAQHLPKLDWQPSDPDAGARASIAAWVTATNVPNVRPPIAFDVRSEPWPIRHAAAILCINMIHIAPWAAAQALLRGAGRLLSRDGVLYLYGPYRRSDRPTASSNEAFDADLRRRNPEWGLRALETVASEAEAHGLRVAEIVDMPANNLSVILRPSGHTG
jgi:hypothetical protein